MKKVVALCLLLCVLAGVFSICVAADDSVAVQFGCSTLKANMPLAGQDKILPSSDGVVLYELNTDTLVYAYKPDNRINPSSMVKIMAALVAIENGNLNDVVTVKRSTLDSVPIGSVSAGLKRDEEISLLDLVHCCLVASANDATAVMAEHIAGSQAAFVDMMNAKAQALGCYDTLFSNVNGLNDNIQFSTARDLAIITAAALENELFAEIFDLKDYVLPATNISDARKIYTTNYMLSDAKVKGYVDSRVTGGKTAAATQTKRSLICTAEIGTARYLCVVMNANSVMSEDNISVVSFGSFVETAQLLDFAEQNYEVRQVLDDSQAFSQYGVQGGGSDIVVSPGGDMFTVLPIDFSAELLQLSTSIDASKLVAPLQKGDVLGYVRVTYGNVILGEYPLAAMFDVPSANTVIRPADPILPDEDIVQESHILRWILIVLGIIVLAYLFVVLCVRLVRNAQIRDLHRRRKRNRRRSR